MTSLRNFTPNVIVSPFARGQEVVIPAGTPLRSTHPRKDGVYYSKRAQTVTVHHTSPGYVDLWNDHKNGRGFVLLPTLTWPGTGGYWVDVKVTPELCKINSVDVPVLPKHDEYDRDRLDTVPAYGTGYDNRDA